MAQYLKPDCELGYIEDNAEIEKIKFDNLRHVVLGCMLGDFDEVGAYVVSPEIVAELISMEKYLVESYDNIELCKSALKLDKQISFMVTFEGNKATLSLVEKINYEANFLLNSGTYSNINEFVLDVVETSGEVNRNVLYDRWNIKVIPGEVVDIFNCDDAVLEKFFGITNRFKYLLHTNKILLEKEEETEEIEAAYINEILQAVAHYSKFDKSVKETIKQTLTEKKGAVSVKKPFFVKTLNEVVENAIQQNLNILVEKEKNEFLIEKRNANVNLNIKREDIYETKKVEIDENAKEQTPKVVLFNIPNQDKTIEEYAQDFASTHKEVQNRISGDNAVQSDSDLFRRTILAVGEKKGVEVNLPTSNHEERDKLISAIKGFGIAGLVEIEEEKKEETKQEEKDNEKSSVDSVTPQKKQGGNTSAGSNNKTNGKGGKQAGGGGGRSQSGGGNGRSNNDKPKKPEAKKEEKKEEEKKYEPFISATYLGGTNSEEGKTNLQEAKDNKDPEVEFLTEEELSAFLGYANKVEEKDKGFVSDDVSLTDEEMSKILGGNDTVENDNDIEKKYNVVFENNDESLGL